MNYEKFSLRNRKVQISLDFRKNIIFSNLIYSVIFKIIICQGLPQTSKNVEQKKALSCDRTYIINRSE